METYAEKNGEEKFDWYYVLKAKIEDLPTYSNKELSEKSISWITCACGNQCSVIERYDSGIPKDKVLYTLGKNFNDYINKQQWKKAKKCLDKIEKQASKLIAEKKEKYINFLEDLGYTVSK